MPRRTDIAGFFWQPTALPFQNPPVGWLEAWSLPKQPTRVAADQLIWVPQSVVQPAASLPFGWFMAWPEPFARTQSLPSFVPFIPLPPITVPAGFLLPMRIAAVSALGIIALTANPQIIEPQAVDAPAVELAELRSTFALSCLRIAGIPSIVGSQMSASLIVFQLNSQFVTVFGLTAALQSPTSTPTYVTDATGTARITDQFGNVVAGPLTFSYVPGPMAMPPPNAGISPGGNYTAPLPPTFNPSPGTTYSCTISLVSPTWGTLTITRATTVQTRMQ